MTDALNELIRIHKIGMCVAECEPLSRDDTMTVKMVKELVYRIRSTELALEECKLDRDRWYSKYNQTQAKLDQIMLEYCPKEMPEEHRKEWGSQQTASRSSEYD